MSESSERLPYKFQRLRETIRQAIESGDLKHRLPGERELARRFGVNAKTIGKALTDLTTEGMLIRRVGRGTFVAGQENRDRVVGSRRRYLWLASSSLERLDVEFMFELFRKRLGAKGHHISWEYVDPDPHGEIPERCLELGRLRSLAGLVLFGSVPSRALLADLSRRHLPVVLCDARSLSIKVSCVIADYAMGAFELTEHFVQMGHEQVMLVLDQQAKWSSALAERGYRTAMGRHGLDPLPSIPGTAKDPVSLVESLTECSAVVCVGGRIGDLIVDRLDAQGAGLPGDFSIAVLPHAGQPGVPRHSLTHYAVEAEHLVDCVVQVLFDQAPGCPPRETLVPGVFRDCGSTHSSSSPPHKPTDQQVAL
jgi:DNA-binding LacI/PurR family transcriptional regulator/DNA-binding transcriptional regulator YhcF (GntR family)